MTETLVQLLLGTTTFKNRSLQGYVFAQLLLRQWGGQHTAAAARGRRFRQRCTLPPENSANPQQLFGNNARRGHIPMKWVKFGLAKDISSRKVWRIKRVYRDDPRVRPPQCQKQAKSFPKDKTNQVAVRSDTCDVCTMYDCALRGEPTQDALYNPGAPAYCKVQQFTLRRAVRFVCFAPRYANCWCPSLLLRRLHHWYAYNAAMPRNKAVTNTINRLSVLCKTI